MKQSLLLTAALSLFITYPAAAGTKSSPTQTKCEDLAPKEVSMDWTKTYKFGFYKAEHDVNGNLATAFTNDPKDVQVAMRCGEYPVIVATKSGPVRKTIYRKGAWFTWDNPVDTAKEAAAAATLLLLTSKILQSPERSVSGG